MRTSEPATLVCFCVTGCFVMAPLGPMVVVAEASAADLVEVLGKAGAFPIVETRWSDAPAAIAEIQPVALVIADPQGRPPACHVHAVTESLATRGGPITPILTLLEQGNAAQLPDALSITLDDSTDRLIARLRSLVRIRTLHACVLQRAHTLGSTRGIPTCVPPDMLEQAILLCVDRGSSYSALSHAVGDRVGLIGALTPESAMRYLDTRDIDGLIIGEGLGARSIGALLAALAQDSRFCELPIGVIQNDCVDDERFPNLVGDGDASRLVDHVLPFVRLQAFERHLTRVLKSLDSDGAIDCDTGLRDAKAFWRDLDRAVHAAEQAGSALSLARFSFDGVIGRRMYLDAARLFARLVRDVDFACRERDGSILAAFGQTDLRRAHIVARRIAGMLRRTMLSLDEDAGSIKPTVTLATLKPTDDIGSLLARVGSSIAAEPQIAAVEGQA
jgi:hypothetical protein